MSSSDSGEVSMAALEFFCCVCCMAGASPTVCHSHFSIFLLIFRGPGDKKSITENPGGLWQASDQKSTPVAEDKLIETAMKSISCAFKSSLGTGRCTIQIQCTTYEVMRLIRTRKHFCSICCFTCLSLTFSSFFIFFTCNNEIKFSKHNLHFTNKQTRLHNTHCCETLISRLKERKTGCFRGGGNHGIMITQNTNQKSNPHGQTTPMWPESILDGVLW